MSHRVETVSLPVESQRPSACFSKSVPTVFAFNSVASSLAVTSSEARTAAGRKTDIVIGRVGSAQLKLDGLNVTEPAATLALVGAAVAVGAALPNSPPL